MRICLVLLRRKVFSWNGVFYGSISLFTYFLFKRNVLFTLLWFLNHKLEKWEAHNLK